MFVVWGRTTNEEELLLGFKVWGKYGGKRRRRNSPPNPLPPKVVQATRQFVTTSKTKQQATSLEHTHYLHRMAADQNNVVDATEGISSKITNRRGPNVIILSAAGKPIFVRYGSTDADGDDADEDEWATACGILQGLRANILSFGFDGVENGSSSLGDICSITAGERLLVFKNTEALTFVAISDGRDGIHNEAWLRLQLEYVYAQVIFTITAQVQSILTNSPSYDLRSMMGPNVNNSIRNLLDEFNPVVDNLYDGNESEEQSSLRRNRNNIIGSSGCKSFLTAGVECIHPIPPEIRDNASKLLIQACGYGRHSSTRSHSENNLFVMLVVGTRLVTIVQPSNPSSQLHTSDIHLILTFVGRQPGLLINELWFPLCLPRFDSSGFLYAYTSCLDPLDTGLSIVMISPDSSTDQFEAFRSAANTVRMKLGLPSVKTGVIRVFDSSTNESATSSVSTPILDNRVGILNESDSASLESDDLEQKKAIVDVASWESDAGKEYANEASDENDHRSPAPLLTALKVALSPKQQEEMMSTYLELASALHFVFRCDIFVNSGQTCAACGDPSTGAMLTQCFGPPLTFPFIDAASQSHVWEIYQRLSLRLRLGSASVESTMNAFDVITDTRDSRESHEYPMQNLLESPPNVHSVTYLQEDDWLFIGLNGKFFELYATLPASLPPKTGTAYCARLVRRLMVDERTLFLSNPLTWGFFG